MSTVNIAGLDKVVVLQRLYERAQAQGIGILRARNEPMSYGEAKYLLEERTYFDYLHGRVMKIDIKGDELSPWGYDRDNGRGAVAEVIAQMYAEKN